MADTSIGSNFPGCRWIAIEIGMNRIGGQLLPLMPELECLNALFSGRLFTDAIFSGSKNTAASSMVIVALSKKV